MTNKKLGKELQEGTEAIADTLISLGNFFQGVSNIQTAFRNINKEIEKEINENKD